MPTPSRTTNQEVIAAAGEILEAAGPAGLTMQAVAARVGIRAPSLYKRFEDRESLLMAVAAAAVDELATRLGAAEPDLARLAAVYRDFAHERPEGFRLIFSATVPQESLRRSVEPVLRAVSSLAGPDRALNGARLFTAWATGFLQMELAGAFRLGGDVDEAFDYGLRRLVVGLGSDRDRD